MRSIRPSFSSLLAYTAATYAPMLDAINRTGLSGFAASASFTAASRASTALVTVNSHPAGARLGVSSGTS